VQASSQGGDWQRAVSLPHVGQTGTIQPLPDTFGLRKTYDFLVFARVRNQPVVGPNRHSALLTKNRTRGFVCRPSLGAKRKKARGPFFSPFHKVTNSSERRAVAAFARFAADLRAPGSQLKSWHRYVRDEQARVP
jgi:hypothetical protein